MLNESSLKWYFKTACISVFCVFTVIFWLSIHSFLGWPALEDDMPETVLVHWVVIKEPNKATKFEGAIYFLLESTEKETSFFGYHSSDPEPRLYGLPYSRGLHEQIEKQMRGKLQRGQPVVGKFSKIKGGQAKKGDRGKSNDKKGGGSESQEQEWQFHPLRPSNFLRKPEE